MPRLRVPEPPAAAPVPLPGVAAGRSMLPGVADACRAAAGVLLEPFRRMPTLGLLLPCAEPAALAGVALAARAGVAAVIGAARRGVAKPPAALPTAGGAVLGALAGVAAAAAGAGVAGVPAAGGLLPCPLSANLRGPVLGAEAGVAGTVACCGAAAAGVAWLLLAPLRLILATAGVPADA